MNELVWNKPNIYHSFSFVIENVNKSAESLKNLFQGQEEFKIWVLEFHHDLSFWVTSQFEFLSFITIWVFFSFITRATDPVLTSDKEEKQIILHTTLNFVWEGENSGVIFSKTPQSYSESLPLLEVIRNVL